MAYYRLSHNMDFLTAGIVILTLAIPAPVWLKAIVGTVLVLLSGALKVFFV